MAKPIKQKTNDELAALALDLDAIETGVKTNGATHSALLRDRIKMQLLTIRQLYETHFLTILRY